MLMAVYCWLFVGLACVLYICLAPSAGMAILSGSHF